MPQGACISESEWAPVKAAIIQLYQVQRMMLKDVVPRISAEWGFHASEKQYANKLSDWGILKTRKRPFWESVGQSIERRDLTPATCAVYVDGMQIPSEKVKKALGRKRRWIEKASTEPSYLKTPPTVQIKPVQGTHCFASDLPASFGLPVSYSHLALDRVSQPIMSDTLTTSVSWPSSISPSLDAVSAYCPPRPPSVFGASHVKFPILNESLDVKSVANIGLGQADIATLLDVRPSMKGSEVLTVISNRLLPYLPIAQQDIESEAANGTKRPLATPHMQGWPSIITMMLANKLTTPRGVRKLIDRVNENSLCRYLKLLLCSKRSLELAAAIEILAAATEAGAVGILREGLAHGASPDMRLSSGLFRECETLLQMALRTDQVAIAEILIDNGADINLSYSKVDIDHHYGFEFHADGIHSSCKWIGYDLPIAIAARSGKSCDLIPTLLQKGAKVPHLPMLAWVIDNYAPLEVVRCLIRAGVDVNQRFYDESGREESLSHPMCAAASRGDAEIVKLLLDEGGYANGPLYAEISLHDEELRSDYHIVCRNFRSPLCFAAERLTGSTNDPYIAVIGLLLEYGADPNVSAMEAFFNDSDIEDCFLVEGLDLDCMNLPYIYPMQTAVRSGSLELVKLLLRHGASLTPPYGVPLLVVAVCASRPHVLDLLLQLKACPDAIGMGGENWSPLVQAIQEGDSEGLAAVRSLLNACADPNLPSSVHDGVCPLQAAADMGNRLVFDALLSSGAELFEIDISIQRSIFISIVEHKWHDLMEVALENWADANTTNDDGVPVFFYAIENADLVAIQLLLRKGANLEGYAFTTTSYMNRCAPLFDRIIFSDTTRLSPIQLAASYGYFDVVSLLLSWGARIDQEPSPENGLTTLHSAVCMQQTDMVMYLLGHKFPVNAVCQAQVRLGGQSNAIGPEQWRSVQLTPLWVAVMKKDIALVQVLLQHGADANASLNLGIADGESLRVLDYAYKQKRTMMELLLLYGGSLTDPFEDDNTFLLSAIEQRDTEWAYALLAARVPVNGRSRVYAHTTALQIACSKWDLQFINYLLDSGANVNVPLSEHRLYDTPLQYATQNGHVILLERLIALGADVNATPRCHRGSTALQAAASKGYLRIAQMLLDHGADICAAAAEYGCTAMDGAIMHGRMQMVQLLLDKYRGPKPLKLLLDAYEAAEEYKQWHIVEMLESYQRPRG